MRLRRSKRVMQMEAANREKQIAETMMGNKDYVGARDKLMKAHEKFTGLANITEMIWVCDILQTSVSELSGCGTDWYWVLRTNKAVGESEIVSKYKSLISLLEPIKNKFPGTESALKLVENAYSVLSDREKRSEFDAKRDEIWSSYRSGEVQESLYPESEVMSEGRQATLRSSSGSKRIASECSNRSNATCNSREHPSKRAKYLGGRDMSFVSACRKNTPVGVERSLGSSSGSPFSLVKAMASKKPVVEYYDFDSNRKSQVFAVGQIWAAYDAEEMPRNYARINNIETSPLTMNITWLKPTPVDADERRWHDVGLPISCGYFKIDKSNMVVDGRALFSHLVSSFQGSMGEPVEVFPQRGEVWALYRDWQPFKWCSDPETRKGCGYQCVEILSDYSKNDGVRVAWLVKVAGFRHIFQRYRDKGSECSSQISAAKLFIFSHKIPAFRFAGGEMDLIYYGMLELDPFSVPEDVVVAKPPLEMRISDIGSSKHKWSHETFASGQIWALYDVPDFMPRRYVIVNNVVSGSAVSVTYLEPLPMLEDEIHWVEKGLPFACGLFISGSTKLNLRLSWFSHLVRPKYNTKTYIQRIYPRKGQVWAMYKNWNPKWKLSSFNRYKYQVVEILSDFSENSAMRIASLERVWSHMTFFQRQLDNGFEVIREVSKKEMLSFSHRIPALTVPEIENHSIPGGSWHLEPDALPPMFSY